VNKNSIFTICYTSGTTGIPKGVMLSHLNFVVNIAGLELLHEDDRYNENDTYISYLPLAHVYERLMLIISMSFRMRIGFYSGDVLKLTQDLSVLKPTVMVSVPRLY
jgi:long-chain acyl-CoA synthetase